MKLKYLIYFCISGMLFGLLMSNTSAKRDAIFFSDGQEVHGKIIEVVMNDESVERVEMSDGRDFGNLVDSIHYRQSDGSYKTERYK